MTDPMLAKLLRLLALAAIVVTGAVLVRSISDALTLALVRALPVSVEAVR